MSEKKRCAQPSGGVIILLTRQNGLQGHLYLLRAATLHNDKQITFNMFHVLHLNE